MKKQSFSTNKLKMTALAVSMLAVSQASWAATLYTNKAAATFATVVDWNTTACGVTPANVSTAAPVATDSIVICGTNVLTSSVADVTVASLEFAGAGELAIGATKFTVTGDVIFNSNATISSTGFTTTNNVTVGGGIITKAATVISSTNGGFYFTDNNHTLGGSGSLSIPRLFVPQPAFTRFININSAITIATTANFSETPANNKGYGFVFAAPTATLSVPTAYTTTPPLDFCDIIGSPATTPFTVNGSATASICNAATVTAPYIAPVYINGEKAKTFAETK